jgi:DNA (cytosine-5)-methyltransferase 1
MLKVLDLFSGIGGFSLGLERTGGFQTVAFCEIEPYCQAVLRKHWPEVPIYDDVRTVTIGRLAADGIHPDVICGGFPCQDISVAGKGEGIEGERSGLWREFARIIGEIRPHFAIMENVSALLGRGMDKVLGDLSALRYDAEWHCIPASAVGAPHRRDRVWIIAYPDAAELRQQSRRGSRQDRPRQAKPGNHGEACPLADADESGWQEGYGNVPGARHRDSPSSGGRHVVRDANGPRLALWESLIGHHDEELSAAIGANWWSVEPDVGRVAHGVSARVDRLAALGNAVVPQIPEIIGRAILAAHAYAQLKSEATRSDTAVTASRSIGLTPNSTSEAV